MGKAPGGVFDFLKGTKDAWQPSTTTFPNVNVEQLAKDMDLVAKGKIRAQNPNVAVDANGNDTVEREIIDNIKGRARTSRNDYFTQIDLYESRLRYAAVDDAAYVQIQSSAEIALSNFKAQIIEDTLTINSHEEAVRKIDRQFKNFVTKHHLHDIAPITASRTELIYGWLWIAAIVLIESVLNGIFFAQGSETGLVGGVTEATMLSILNISLAGGIGLLSLRYIRHRSIYWKFFAFITLVIFACSIPALNLLIAHYRETFINAAGQVVLVSNVLESYRTNTFGLNDAKSWLLAGFGILLNILAIYKLFHLYDPYPGFGNLAARRNDIISRLNDERRYCIDILTRHRDDAVTEMNEAIQLIASRYYDFQLVLNLRDRLYRLFKDHLDELESVAAMLGMIYINETEATEHRPNAKRLILKLEQPPDLHTVITGDNSSHQRAISTMKEYIERINKEYGIAVEHIGNSERIGTTTHAST